MSRTDISEDFYERLWSSPPNPSTPGNLREFTETRSPATRKGPSAAGPPGQGKLQRHLVFRSSGSECGGRRLPGEVMQLAGSQDGGSFCTERDLKVQNGNSGQELLEGF